MPSAHSQSEIREQPKILAGHSHQAYEAEKSYSSLESVKKEDPRPTITGIRIIGDSLSDAGRKYREKFFGIIPCHWFLHKSKKGEFTDDDVWAVYFSQKINALRDKLAPPCKKINQPLVDNQAEGGATLYNYWSLKALFKWPKGFFGSFFLGNVARQVDELKNNEITPKDLVIGWSGANDLVTLGYQNEACVERLLQSTQSIIETVTTPQYEALWLHKDNHAHEMIFFTLPDVSCTPRFAHKTEAERKNIQKLCNVYNEGLKKLHEEYQYIDFSYCPIYSVKSTQSLGRVKENLQSQGQEKAIVFIGEGEQRQVCFLNKGKYLKRDKEQNKNQRKKLLKEQNKNQQNKNQRKKLLKDMRNNLRVFDLELKAHQSSLFPVNEQAAPIDQKLMNPIEAGHVIGKVLAEAKLTANISVIDVAEEFKKILEHPEKYNLTVGCAILYATQPLTAEDLKKRPRDENAVILIPCSLKSNCYQLQIVQKGQFIFDSPLTIQLSPCEEKWVEQRLRLKNNLNHPWLYRIGCFLKLFRRQKIVPLLAEEGLHSELVAGIIDKAIKEYKKNTKKDLVLTKIYKSVLELDKEGHPTANVAFWDDLHPAEVIHKIIAQIAEKDVSGNYRLDWARSRELESDVLEDDHNCFLGDHFRLLAHPRDASVSLKQASPVQVRHSEARTIESAPLDVVEVLPSQESLTQEWQNKLRTIESTQNKQESKGSCTDCNSSFWSQKLKTGSFVDLLLGSQDLAEQSSERQM